MKREKLDAVLGARAKYFEPYCEYGEKYYVRRDNEMRKFLSFLLFLDVSHKTHVSSSFDRTIHCSLLLSCKTRALAGDDAAVRIDELLEKIDIFVVDVSDIVLGQDVVGHVGIFIAWKPSQHKNT